MEVALLNAIMKIQKKIFIWIQMRGNINPVMKHAIHAPKVALLMIINVIHVL